MQSFDVIVVGAGHAGCEAAAAAARLGARVALVTLSADNVGRMSCNPAIGGLGKGHLVREIDALDGLMGRVADAAGIQFRLLNRSRGPAVRGPRAQADRRRYAAAMRAALATQAGLTLIEASVDDLLVADAGGRRTITGVRTSRGDLSAAAVVLTTGTFLGGVIHIGSEQRPGGRVGEPASALGGTLRRLGLPLARLKTGTPPRLDGRTIDWGALELQPGDAEPVPFSALTTRPPLPQVACGITRTMPATHELVRAHVGESPVYAGAIEGRGPRYCPSIEDKVMRFGDRDGHQVFLEPEGLDTPLIYPNGISTALPAAVQAALVATLPGCERARIVQPGYAIEYSHVDPRALGSDLAMLDVAGLYLAGQINGTTGYEEAAAQGLVAGLNAARAAGGQAPVTIGRAEGYIGVMIDDLVTQGVSEPYRMFTSRAEYRLRLRIDNADLRLTPLGEVIGCLGAERRAAIRRRAAALRVGRAALAVRLSPSELAAAGIDVRQDGMVRTLGEWLRFPAVEWADAVRLAPTLAQLSTADAETLEIDARYAAYVERQEEEVAALRRDEALRLPASLDFGTVAGLSVEMVERLSAARPTTLGQASRVAGVTPAALTALLAHARRAA